MPTRTALSPQIEQFLHDNPQGVLTSFRRNGMPQLSIVTVYPRDGGVGISITETRAKFRNLLRDPRCAVLVSHADWWSGFLVFEGRAELIHSGNADPEAESPWLVTVRYRGATVTSFNRRNSVFPMKSTSGRSLLAPARAGTAPAADSRLPRCAA